MRKTTKTAWFGAQHAAPNKPQGKTVMGRAISALDSATTEMTNLIDIGEIGEESPLDRKVHAALEDLYEAVHEIKRASRRQARLMERGPLVFPVRGRDMRFWLMSNGRKASTLLSDHQASRFASARKVRANPALNRYRVMTARQYLQALEDAVIEEHGPESNRGYERVRILV